MQILTYLHTHIYTHTSIYERTASGNVARYSSFDMPTNAPASSTALRVVGVCVYVCVGVDLDRSCWEGRGRRKADEIEELAWRQKQARARRRPWRRRGVSMFVCCVCVCVCVCSGKCEFGNERGTCVWIFWKDDTATTSEV